MRYMIVESKVPDQWYIKKRWLGLWWTVGVRTGLAHAAESVILDKINADLASTADEVIKL